MKVGDLVPERFVVHLAWLETDVNGLCEQAHFFQVAVALFMSKLIQLGRVAARHQHAIAGVILPGTEQGHRMRELPDEVVVRQFVEALKSLT